MTIKSIQDLLPLVERPSRYLGTEINTIRKDPSTTELKFVLAFPDLYEIGTSHFGIQILYHILNRHSDIAAERVFAPAKDLGTLLRSSGVSLMSMETHTPLKKFDILGFSLLYELNYTNILTILDLAGIPFLSHQRDSTFPLVIGGGPCTCNPEPVADFFDAFVVGDGEDVVLEMAAVWLLCKKNAATDKTSILNAWSAIKGVYIPDMFPVHYDHMGFQVLTPVSAGMSRRRKKVERAVLADLDQAAFPQSPVIPFGKPIHDRLRLEVSRGCTRGCRFCQAGMIYRPVRERSEATLMKLSDISLAKTGYEDISLLSLSIGDYSCIASLMAGLMEKYKAGHTAVSLPSLRAETLTPELMALIKKMRKTGFTIAPEAGSQRLRNVINKNITRDEIVETVKNAFSLGWQVIKLYFMIGLPTETDEDLHGIVDLVEELRNIRSETGRRGKLNVSVTTFIPKPHTPFQWFSQISVDESRKKIAWLRSNLKKPGIHFKWQSPEVSFLEGLWARGDRRLGRLLLSAYKKGCRFDGWSDHFKYTVWESALEDTGTDVHFYTTRKRDLSEPLPWDHLDMKVTKAFLKQEWQSALDGQKTTDCRWNPCHNCGVCDFETVQPQLFDTCDERAVLKTENDDKMPEFNKVLQVVYAKTGQAKYFGHLELANIIIRALRRAGIPVKYSEGFHPKPKISFDDSLPIGMESFNERFYITVPEHVTCEDIKSRFSAELPDGIDLKGCTLSNKKRKQDEHVQDNYTIQLKEGRFDRERLNRFLYLPEYTYTRTNRKGKKRTFDLKKVVSQIELKDTKRLLLQVQKENETTLRPAEILMEIFSLSRKEVQLATVIKGMGEHV